MAYELIETIEVGAGGASSIEWTGIPQDGVDLVCVLSSRNTSNGDLVGIHFNGTSGFTNYAGISLYGNGASVSSTSGNINYTTAVNASSTTANTFSNSSWHISNYTISQAKSISSDSVVEENVSSSSDLAQTISAMSWSITDPITALKLSPFSNNFAQYSTASLYKIY